MKRKVFFVFLVISFLPFFNVVSSANIIFKMQATKSTLTLNETAVFGLYASIEEETTGLNGINLWQLDMIVNTKDVITVTNIEMLEPYPLDDDYFPYYLHLNKDPLNTANSFSGNMLGLGSGMDGAFDDSPAGVGGFTLMANITIQAVGLGTTTYDIVDTGRTGVYAYLADASLYDIVQANPWSIKFYDKTASTGNNIFTVVPEPSSLILLASMAGMALYRRRVGVGK